MSRRHQFIICLVCFIVISISLLAAESQIPQVIPDWQKAAQNSIAQNDTTKALEYYRKIQESFPNTPHDIQAQIQIVNLYLQNGQPDKISEALAQLKNNYASFPEYVKLVHEYRLGVCKKT